MVIVRRVIGGGDELSFSFCVPFEFQGLGERNGAPEKMVMMITFASESRNSAKEREKNFPAHFYQRLFSFRTLHEQSRN